MLEAGCAEHGCPVPKGMACETPTSRQEDGYDRFVPLLCPFMGLNPGFTEGQRVTLIGFYTPVAPAEEPALMHSLIYWWYRFDHQETMPEPWSRIMTSVHVKKEGHPWCLNTTS